MNTSKEEQAVEDAFAILCAKLFLLGEKSKQDMYDSIGSIQSVLNATRQDLRELHNVNI